MATAKNISRYCVTRATFKVLIVSVLLQVCNGNVLNFYAMVAYRTNLRPFDFNNYGHYCGLGGTGSTLDDVDQCCLHHDKCYISIGGGECASSGGGLAPFLTYYRWEKLPNGTIICDDDPTQDLCASNICNCDRLITECLLKNKKTFNGHYKKTLMWRLFEKFIIRNIFPESW